MSRYIIGLDLGQATDYTAVVVLERTERDTGRRETVQVRQQRDPFSRAVSVPVERPVLEGVYAARHLERFPIGTHYPEQVERIGALVRRLSRPGSEVRLVVDQTGMGRPVVDMLRAAKLSPVAVTITGATPSTRRAGVIACPRGTSSAPRRCSCMGSGSGSPRVTRSLPCSSRSS